MENKELVNELWQNVLNRMQGMSEDDLTNQGYTALFSVAKVSYDESEHLLTIEFPADNEFSFRAVMVSQIIQDTLRDFVQDEFGSAVTCKVKKAPVDSNNLPVEANTAEDEDAPLTIEEIEKLPCVVPLFKKRFNDLFNRANTNNKQFMRETGLSETVFSEMRRGTRNSFRRKTLRRACGGLDCSDYELISGTEFQDLLSFNETVETNRQKMFQTDQAPTKTLDELLIENELYLHDKPDQSPERFVLYPYMTSDISEMKPIDQVKFMVALVNYGGYGVDTGFPYPFSAKFNQYKRSVDNYKRKFKESLRTKQQACPW